MLANKEITYKKAYKELYSVIENLTRNEINKIPKELLENIKREMDNTYEFSIDKTKSFLEQDLMPETQALIIVLYQKYLLPKDDEEKWKKYNYICYQKIELEKKKKCNEIDFFKNNKEIDETKQKQLSVVENKGFIERIIEKIKEIFKVKKYE